MGKEPIGKYMKMIHLSMEKDFNRLMAADDLTHVQCDFLAYIGKHNNQEVNPVDIERAFYLSRPTVAGILKRLEAKDFIQFRESLKDKRYKQVILTDKAGHLWEKIKAHIEQMEGRMIQGISQEDQDTLTRILKQVLKNVAD